MDIPALSMALSQTKVMNQVGTAVLAMNMENMRSEENAVAELLDVPTTAMERSVQPHIGGNIDISL